MIPSRTQMSVSNHQAATSLVQSLQGGTFSVLMASDYLHPGQEESVDGQQAGQPYEASSGVGGPAAGHLAGEADLGVIDQTLEISQGGILTLENGQVIEVPGLDVLPLTVSLDQLGESQVLLQEGEDGELFLYGEEASFQAPAQKRKPGRPKKADTALPAPIGKGPFHCQVCQEKFSHWTAYKKHTKTHESDRRFRCTECGSSFNLEKNLLLHLAGHQTGDSLECPECGRVFSRIASLRSHLAIHEEEDNLPCPRCGDEFPTDRALERHVILKHSATAATTTQSSLAGGGQRRRQTRLTETLLNEMVNGGGGSGFAHALVCRICNKEFNSSAAFKEHKLQHKKLKSSLELRKKINPDIARDGFNHVCRFCGKKFSKPSQVKRHERVHTGECPFKCNVCGKSFNQKTSLDAHALRHTGQKPQACPFCPLRFVQRGNLRSHIKRVHKLDAEAQSRINCSLCTCTFKKAGSLHSHMSRFHPKEKESLEPKEEISTKDFKSVEEEKPKQSKDSEELLIDECNSFHSQEWTLEFEEQTLTPGAEDDEEGSHDLAQLTGKEGSHEFAQLTGKQVEKNFSPKDAERGDGMDQVDRKDQVDQADQVDQVDRLDRVDWVDRMDQPKVVLDRGSRGKGDGRSDDLLSRALESAINQSTALDDPGEAENKNFVVLADKSVEGKVRKHLVRVGEDEEGSPVYQCSWCNRSFKKPSDLIRHIRVHTKEKPYACPHCPRAFSVKSTLSSHLRVHLSAKRPACDRCSQTFVTVADLKKHRRRQHGGCVDPVTQKASSQITSISKTETKMKRASLLEEGVERKELNGANMEPLVITSSGIVQNISRFASVYNPPPSEAGLRQYQCSYCTAAFKKSSHLKQHTRKHTGERPYHCFKCKKQFMTRGSLNMHIKTHVRVKLFECGVCRCTFTTQGSVRRHMTTHQMEKPYLCPFCNKAFKTKVNCKKHIKLHKRREAEEALEYSTIETTILVNDSEKEVVSSEAAAATAAAATAVESRLPAAHEEDVTSMSGTKPSAAAAAAAGTTCWRPLDTSDRNHRRRRPEAIAMSNPTEELQQQELRQEQQQELEQRQEQEQLQRQEPFPGCGLIISRQADSAASGGVVAGGGNRDSQEKQSFCRPEKEPGHPFVIFDPSYLGPPQASSDLDFPRHETAAVAATASMEAAAAVDVSDTGNLVVYQAQSQTVKIPDNASILEHAILEDTTTVSSSRCCPGPPSPSAPAFSSSMTNNSVDSTKNKPVSKAPVHSTGNSGSCVGSAADTVQLDSLPTLVIEPTGFPTAAALGVVVPCHDGGGGGGSGVQGEVIALNPQDLGIDVSSLNFEHFGEDCLVAVQPESQQCQVPAQPESQQFLVPAQPENQQCLVSAQPESQQCLVPAQPESHLVQAQLESQSFVQISPAASNLTQSVVQLSRPFVASRQKPVVSLQQPVASFQEPVISLHQPVASLQRPVASLQQSVPSLQQSVVISLPQPDASFQQPIISLQQPVVVSSHQPTVTINQPATFLSQPRVYPASSQSPPYLPSSSGCGDLSTSYTSSLVNGSFPASHFETSTTTRKEVYADRRTAAEPSYLGKPPSLVAGGYGGGGDQQATNLQVGVGHGSEFPSNEMSSVKPGEELAQLNQEADQQATTRPHLWRCGACGLELDSLDLMSAHISSEHEKSKKEDEGNTMSSHVVKEDSHSRQTRTHFKCDECGDVFSKGEELASHKRSHVKTHVVPETYQCSVCKANFSSKSSFVRHQNVHTDKSHRCGHAHCSATFKTLSSLSKHNIEEHAGDPGQFLDTELKRRLASQMKLSEEETRILANTPKETAKTISEKILLDCVSEPKSSVDDNWENGKVVHVNKCNQCSKSFKKPSDLTRHLRTHTGEKPYQCTKCDKRFAVKSTLGNHMKVHSGAKSLACHVCGSLFAGKHSLKVHMRLHTGSLPYKCKFCDQWFRTPAGRKTHTEIHLKSGEKPLPLSAATGSGGGGDLVPLTISAESLTAALEAVASSGAPLLGATVQLQLHGTGFRSALTQLHIDEEVLSQLRRGENININITNKQLNQGASFKDDSKTMEPVFQADTLPTGSETKVDSSSGLNSFPLSQAVMVNTDTAVSPKVDDHLRRHENPTPAPPPPPSEAGGGDGAKDELFADEDNARRGSRRIPLPPPPALSARMILNLGGGDSGQYSRNHRHHQSASTDLKHDSQSAPERFLLLAPDHQAEGLVLGEEHEAGQQLGEEEEEAGQHLVKTGQFQVDAVARLDGGADSILQDSRLRAHDAIDLRAHEAVDLRAHDAVDLRVHDTVDLRAHDVVELQAHEAVQLQHMDLSQVYICPWCDRVFEHEEGRIRHLLADHGIEVREDGGGTREKLGQEDQAGGNTQSRVSMEVEAEEENEVRDDDTEEDEEGAAELKELVAKPEEGIELKLAKAGSTLPCLYQTDLERRDCDSLSTSQENLLSGGSSNTCAVCNKYFKKPSQLKRHLRVHTGERPFPCSLCPKSFNQKNALQTHLKKHTGEKPFVCQFCSLAFSQKGNLKLHIARAHAQ